MGKLVGFVIIETDNVPIPINLRQFLDVFFLKLIRLNGLLLDWNWRGLFRVIIDFGASYQSLSGVNHKNEISGWIYHSHLIAQIYDIRKIGTIKSAATS